MSRDSLENIRKIFKSFNDRLGKIEDPKTHSRKRPLNYDEVVDEAKQYLKEEKRDIREENKYKKVVQKTLDKHAERIRKLEKIDKVTGKFSGGNILLSAIELDILNTILKISIGNTKLLGDIFTLLKRDKISPTPDAIPTRNEINEKELDEKNDEYHSLKGGILGTIGITLFALFPMIMKLLHQKKQEISDFLFPAFQFVLEDVPKFFTESIPNFFTKNIPKWFNEKFDVVADLAKEMGDNLAAIGANIKRSVGETIVSISNLIPDNFGSLKTSIKEYGESMVKDADKTLDQVDENRKQRDDSQTNKHNKERLIKMAETHATKYVKEHKELSDYEVQYDDKKNLITINYKAKDGGAAAIETFSASESIQKGELTGSKNATISPTPKSNAVPMSITPSIPKPLEASVGVSGGSKGGNIIPMATVASTASVAGSNGSKGAQITQATQAVVAAKSKPIIETLPVQKDTKQPAKVIKEGIPHDISDVPDPTPYMGNLASQLFYNQG